MDAHVESYLLQSFVQKGNCHTVFAYMKETRFLLVGRSQFRPVIFVTTAGFIYRIAFEIRLCSVHLMVFSLEFRWTVLHNVFFPITTFCNAENTIQSSNFC